MTVLPGFAQSAAATGPDSPQDPQQILAAAAPFYDFSSPELKPWHAKVTYQLYDLDGKPTDQGTWEYRWASPKVSRSSWTRPGVEQTIWHTTAGAVYRKESGGPLRYFERTMEQMLLAPWPLHLETYPSNFKLGLKTITVSGAKLDCVTATPQWKVDSTSLMPASTQPNDYCFDPATHALLLTGSQQVVIEEFGKVVKMQGRYVARQIVVTDGKRKLFTASVDTLEGFTPSDAWMTPSADAVPLPRTMTAPGGKLAKLTGGALVKKTSAAYPETARIAREHGVVVLGTVIGTDGKVRDVEVLATPSKLLAQSAVEAVKQWVYTPYMFGGVPVEMSLMVNVTFRSDQ